MPIDPSLGSQLADLGGFALFLLLVLVIGVGLLRRWWVPGWLWMERTAERDEARAEVRELRATVERLTVQLGRERRRRASDNPDG